MQAYQAAGDLVVAHVFLLRVNFLFLLYGGKRPVCEKKTTSVAFIPGELQCYDITLLPIQLHRQPHGFKGGDCVQTALVYDCKPLK